MNIWQNARLRKKKSPNLDILSKYNKNLKTSYFSLSKEGLSSSG